jgi:23S rRNA (uridine2552-2'-O)-methyltransferase
MAAGRGGAKGGGKGGGRGSGTSRGGPGGGRRQATVKVRDARRKRATSQRWLQRQLNDPYVAAAQREGYRSRAAFKLIEIDDKAHLLKPGQRVVDLGAAPGGWTQVAVARVHADRPGGGPKGGQVVALDILDMPSVPGATVVKEDFLAEGADTRLMALLEGPVDVVLSDLSPNTTGHAPTDHLRIVGLVEAALDFACRVLAPGGAFVAKVFQGGTEAELLTRLRARFDKVSHVKPPASRSDSKEVYVVATGFKGGGE